MKLRGRVVVLLMVLSLFIGAGGSYFTLNTINSQQLAVNDQSSQVDMNKIKSTIDLIAQDYVKEVDKSKLVEGAIKGIVDTLDDPYSVYMNAETAKQFNQSLSSSFEGIGAEVSMKDGKVTIVSPFKGSPAEKAGLKPNDQILKVDGNSIEGLDLYDAVLKIRGKKGSTVTLQVERPGLSDPLNVDVIRDEIPMETVYGSLKDYQGKKVGYIEITSFSENTASRFEEELNKFEKQGIDGLVIDVRGNPGGYLQTVEGISKLILTDKKPIVQVENRQGKRDKFFSPLKEKKSYPIVGLIDRGSASASEILAGALSEAGGYKLVGEKSFGKGTVQQAFPLDDGSNIKLTLFKWLTPDGNWIHKKGIKPDIAIKQPDYFYTSPLQVKEPLAYDSNNEQVKNAQRMLKGLGFEPGRADGYFSKQTEIAVKAFQQKHKLAVTGQIDKQTAGLIETKMIELVQDESNDVQLKAAMSALFK